MKKNTFALLNTDVKSVLKKWGVNDKDTTLLELAKGTKNAAQMLEGALNDDKVKELLTHALAIRCAVGIDKGENVLSIELNYALNPTGFMILDTIYGGKNGKKAKIAHA